VTQPWRPLLSNPWVAWPAQVDDVAGLARRTAIAHDRFVEGAPDASGVRPVVLESWRRSMTSGIDPDRNLPPVDLIDDDLAAYRDAHPLAPLMPLVRRLLVEDAVEAGLIVAVTDADGRLLWVEGESGLRSRAEGMNFIAGARWGEQWAGTNAPAMALRNDHLVQVFASEHFARNVAPWSCTAAPIHDPVSGNVLGAIDLTGGDAVAGPQAYVLVRAAVAAVESELRLLHLGAGHAPVEKSITGARLDVLGRTRALLTFDGRAHPLGLRHSELLLLLSLHPAGLSAEQVAVLLHDDEIPLVTVRAELSRLRALVPGLDLKSRPYRLSSPVLTDLDDVHALLDGGRLRLALARYAGPVLPRSDAPEVRRLRDQLSSHLRSAVLAQRDVEFLMAWAQTSDGHDDVTVWRACLSGLPAGSPRLSAVLGHLADLERVLG
jgi:hypothetical protein